MRRTINNVISVVISAIRFGLIKLFHLNSFHCSIIERFSPNVITEFNKNCKVKLGRKVRVHSGSKIKVRSGGELTIGDNVKINYNCIIVCKKKISIGSGTEFGPNVFLFDHDHDYRFGLSAESDKERFLETPIIIGQNCWIGANTVILRGTEIGDNCVVGAGSVIKGKYESNTIIVQKRSTDIGSTMKDRKNDKR